MPFDADIYTSQSIYAICMWLGGSVSRSHYGGVAHEEFLMNILFVCVLVCLCFLCFVILYVCVFYVCLLYSLQQRGMKRLLLEYLYIYT